MIIEIVETTEKTAEQKEKEQEKINKAIQIVNALENAAKKQGKKFPYEDLIDRLFFGIKLINMDEKEFNKIYKLCGL